MDDAGVTLQAEMRAMGEAARAAAIALRLASADQRTAALAAMAEAISSNSETILAANARDAEAARLAGLAEPMVDRLTLGEAGVRTTSQALRTVSQIPDPVGAETERWTRPNGL